MIGPPPTLETRLADLSFRHANLVRELYESRGKIAFIRGQLARTAWADRHLAQQALDRLQAEHARLDSCLARLHEQLRCALSPGS